MKPSTWVLLALCLYLLLEAAYNSRRKGKPLPHRHRGMMLAVVLTLVTAAAVLYERGY